jgi:Ca2+-binding EF-hand superfamily protein
MSIGAIGSSSCQSAAQAWKDKMFKKADTDGDGKISADEFAAFTQKMESRKGTSSADATGAAGAVAKPDAATLFKSFDTDGSGSLSESELTTGMKRLHQSTAHAVKQHKSGDSEQLMDMLFGNSTDGSATDSTSVADISSALGSSSSSDGSSTGNATSNSSTNNSSLSTDTMRLQQWMLDAFSSQFNVSSTLAQAA